MYTMGRIASSRVCIRNCFTSHGAMRHSLCKSACSTLDLMMQAQTKNMVKLQYENEKQYKLTLPKQIIQAKGWKKGDEIIIILDENGNIVLKKERRAEKREEGRPHYVA